jgi:hypothetical protein
LGSKNGSSAAPLIDRLAELSANEELRLLSGRLQRLSFRAVPDDQPRATAAWTSVGPDPSDDVGKRLADAESEAVRKLVRTAPTTLAGVRALVTLIAECESRGDDVLNVYMSEDEADTLARHTFLTTLAASLDRIATRD